MPSYTSIINALLRLMPGDRRADALKSVVKLHPHGEAFSDKTYADLLLDDHTRGWQTRHAVEACRGWKWPYWLTVQMFPSSLASQGLATGPVLHNTSARDVVAIPGLAGTFAGTMDRRGMVTAPGARFSVETWFRFGDEVIYPSELFSERAISYTTARTGVQFCYDTGSENLCIQASAAEYADLRFIELTLSRTAKPDRDPRPITIYVSIRPYTTEGVAPLHDLVYNSKGFWMSESHIVGWFTSRPNESWAGDARHGDAAFFMEHPPERTAVRCPAGMATAVSAFHFYTSNREANTVKMIVPLEPAQPRQFPFAELLGREGRLKSGHSPAVATDSEQEPAIRLEHGHWAKLLDVADAQLRSLTDIRSVETHKLFPYHNHWLVAGTRALLYQGHFDAAERLLQFPALNVQKNGYLDLAGGRWGFQGQFLTALADYYRLTRKPADESILAYQQVRMIARWIMRKRKEISHAPAKPTGLLPPGVTRSGTGMEYQLADNLWCLEGLEAAAWLARHFGEHSDADMFKRDAARYAANINAAIHRELEYGLSQQVPGRLHRAFDAASAAELLDIALMQEARVLLRAEYWLDRLVHKLAEPLDPGREHETNLTGGRQFILRQIDDQGVSPARRALLGLAMLTLRNEDTPVILGELLSLHTPFDTWPQYLNIHTGMGNGRVMNDPEAAALFTLLTRQMLITEGDNEIQIAPAVVPEVLGGCGKVILKNTPTVHGRVSALLAKRDGDLELELKTDISDPTIDISWCRAEPDGDGTFPCHTPVNLGPAKAATGVHTQKFPQPSNNTTS